MPSRFLITLSILTVIITVTSVWDFLRIRNYPSQCEMTYSRPVYTPLTLSSIRHHKYQTYRLHMKTYTKPLTGVPVIFLPGQKGSYKQARSIAQHLSDINPKLFDIFTVDFCQELTALHGNFVLEQATYVNTVIRAILKLYKKKSTSSQPSSVLIVAHSMGGIVAQVATELTSYKRNSINHIIALGTSYKISPFPFDSTASQIYADVRRDLLHHDSKNNKNFASNVHLYTNDADRKVSLHTIVSIAGGHKDQMIHPSFSLPMHHQYLSERVFPILTTGLPNVETTMDHLCLLWCHQLLKIIASSIEQMVDQPALDYISSTSQKMDVLKKHYLKNHQHHIDTEDVTDEMKLLEVIAERHVAGVANGYMSTQEYQTYGMIMPQDLHTFMRSQYYLFVIWLYAVLLYIFQLQMQHWQHSYDFYDSWQSSLSFEELKSEKYPSFESMLAPWKHVPSPIRNAVHVMVNFAQLRDTASSNPTDNINKNNTNASKSKSAKAEKNASAADERRKKLWTSSIYEEDESQFENVDTSKGQTSKSSSSARKYSASFATMVQYLYGSVIVALISMITYFTLNYPHNYYAQCIQSLVGYIVMYLYTLGLLSCLSYVAWLVEKPISSFVTIGSSFIEKNLRFTRMVLLTALILVIVVVGTVYYSTIGSTDVNYSSVRTVALFVWATFIALLTKFLSVWGSSTHNMYHKRYQYSVLSLIALWIIGSVGTLTWYGTMIEYPAPELTSDIFYDATLTIAQFLFIIYQLQVVEDYMLPKPGSAYFMDNDASAVSSSVPSFYRDDDINSGESKTLQPKEKITPYNCPRCVYEDGGPGAVFIEYSNATTKIIKNTHTGEKVILGPTFRVVECDCVQRYYSIGSHAFCQFCTRSCSLCGGGEGNFEQKNKYNNYLAEESMYILQKKQEGSALVLQFLAFIVLYYGYTYPHSFALVHLVVVQLLLIYHSFFMHTKEVL